MLFLQVTINSHVVELANVATDYKFQGRSERCIILSMMLPGCSKPRIDIHGLYVLLTRTTRGRDGMRLLLSEGTSTLQDLKYLLQLKRPKDLIILLRGYNEDGYWQDDLAKDAFHALGGQ